MKRNKLHLSGEQFRLMFEQSEDILFEWDLITDTICFSEKFEILFGYTPVEQNIRSNPEVSAKIHPDDLEAFQQWLDDIFTGQINTQAQFRVLCSNGNYLWMHSRSAVIFDHQGTPVQAIGAFININQQKKELETLLQRAQRDPLTQLLNKKETHLQIEERLTILPTEETAAFIIFDIDNFKGVNDTLGHQFGDMILTEIADKIKKITNHHDIVGRVGGDEFVIFLSNIKDESSLHQKLTLLLQRLHNTYFGESTQYTISVSVGVSLYPLHGTTFSDLYRISDIALYESKQKGKNCFTIYQEHLLEAKESSHTPVEYEGRFLNTYFSGDTIFNVFEMLYETKDVNMTVNMILEFLGKQFHVDRVYIFEYHRDGLHVSNTFEWCASGVTSERASLQNLQLEDLRHFISNYNGEGIFCCDNLRCLDEFSYENLSRQGIKSLLHCAIYDHGNMTGFIGFDDCQEERLWRGEEIATLGYISRILSVFLLKNKISRELLQSYANHVEMLGNLNGYVYVIDPDTYELLYLNNSMLQLGVELGQKCHQMAFGLDTPCKNCPVKKLSKENPFATEEIYSEILKGWVSSAASQLTWSGNRNAALICCTDISKYKP